MRTPDEAAAELNTAIESLLASEKQDAARMDGLADYLIRGLADRGLDGVRGGSNGEIKVPGFGRTKTWDVAYSKAEKPRLLVSLKSILKNIKGTVPNRIDDLMGEVANVQLLHPEVVIGSAAIMDDALNGPRKVDKSRANDTWIDYFTRRIGALAVRKPPVWGAGLVEAFWIIRIDTRLGAGHRIPDVTRTVAGGETLLDSLVAALRVREPLLFPHEG